jgi:hypothetical protein
VQPIFEKKSTEAMRCFEDGWHRGWACQLIREIACSPRSVGVGCSGEALRHLAGYLGTVPACNVTAMWERGSAAKCKTAIDDAITASDAVVVERTCSHRGAVACSSRPPRLWSWVRPITHTTPALACLTPPPTPPLRHSVRTCARVRIRPRPARPEARLEKATHSNTTNSSMTRQPHFSGTHGSTHGSTHRWMKVSGPAHAAGAALLARAEPCLLDSACKPEKSVTGALSRCAISSLTCMKHVEAMVVFQGNGRVLHCMSALV